MFCPYCGRKIDDDSVFCVSCGSRVDEKLHVQPIEPQTPTCRFCGNTLNSDSVFCDKCGNKVNQAHGCASQQNNSALNTGNQTGNVKGEEKSSSAKAGFILSLIGLILFFIPFLPLGLSIPGLVLSAKGKHKAGKILGIIAICLTGFISFIVMTDSSDDVFYEDPYFNYGSPYVTTVDFEI